MHVIEHTYISLLADVSRLTGFSEIRGSYEGLQWCLNEAPKLEKYVLSCVESGDELDLARFPTWLQRLARGSVMDPQLMRYLRQLLLFCYKAEVTHDKPTTEKAFAGFISCNADVGSTAAGLSRSSPVLLNSVRRHCQSVLYQFHPERIKPSHGPGAVTTSKTKWRNWYSTIESLYPYSDWLSMYYNEGHAAEIADCSWQDTIEAKLIAVPKDSRGPRLICVHPAEAIWIQQGLRRELERVISLKRHCRGPWPRGKIHFNDQSVNGRIAMLSSRSRRYATIDMKEASDRVSDVLVQILFGRMYKYFGCCRAQRFVIPEYSHMRNLRGNIHSYAPMGNATTFPVQSLVFWSICVAVLQRLGFHQPGACFVFGDDIIIPTEATEAVIDGLESFGLLVNRSKSFWRGAFRESCGVDAFNGVDVTPTRWKTTLDAKHLTGLQALSDIAMRLRIAGYEEAARTTYSALARTLRSRYGKSMFRTNNDQHGGIAEYTTNSLAVWTDAYWHRDKQWFCSPVWRVEEIAESSASHGWNHVLNAVCGLERRKTPYPMAAVSSDPLSTVSRRSRLNRGWMEVR